MNYYLNVERISYEEPYHIQLVWNASNGNTDTKFEYYDNASSLTEIGKNLEVFPRHGSDVYLYEIGSEKPEDRFAYYFRLRAFTVNSRGGSAIQIRFCNNRELPYREIIEFCIITEPTDIARLGKLFLKFAKLEHEFISWSESESYIGTKSKNA